MLYIGEDALSKAHTEDLRMDGKRTGETKNTVHSHPQAEWMKFLKGFEN
jgi:hypothetical protein